MTFTLGLVLAKMPKLASQSTICGSLDSNLKNSRQEKKSPASALSSILCSMHLMSKRLRGKWIWERKSRKTLGCVFISVSPKRASGKVTPCKLG